MEDRSQAQKQKLTSGVQCEVNLYYVLLKHALTDFRSKYFASPDLRSSSHKMKLRHSEVPMQSTVQMTFPALAYSYSTSREKNPVLQHVVELP